MFWLLLKHNLLSSKPKMICPFCSSSKTKVIDKREAENLMATRRRRECLMCGKRFTTYERIETAEIRIVKRDGRREHYMRQKLKIGLLKACEKRPISTEKIDALIDDIELELRNYKSTEIPSKKIGEIVMEELKNLDEVAYIRFASVYKKFTDIKSFEKELGKLKKEV